MLETTQDLPTEDIHDTRLEVEPKGFTMASLPEDFRSAYLEQQSKSGTLPPEAGMCLGRDDHIACYDQFIDHGDNSPSRSQPSQSNRVDWAQSRLVGDAHAFYTSNPLDLPGNVRRQLDTHFPYSRAIAGADAVAQEGWMSGRNDGIATQEEMFTYRNRLAQQVRATGNNAEERDRVTLAAANALLRNWDDFDRNDGMIHKQDVINRFR